MKGTVMRKSWLIILLVVALMAIGILALLDSSDQLSGGQLRPNEKIYDYSIVTGEFDFESYHERADYFIIAFYTIEDGELGPVITPTISETQYTDFTDELNLSLEEMIALQENLRHSRTVWALVKGIIPAPYLKHIIYLEIFTDGVDNFLGAIEEVEGRTNSVILSIDLGDMLDDQREVKYNQLVETIVHELAHIITLSSDQAAWLEEEDSNPDTYFIFEYDLDTYEDSYMNQFFQLFWADLFDEWSAFFYKYGVLYEGDEALADEYEEILMEHLDNFYETHREKFITNYAATSPTEDIAESFTYFVFDDSLKENLKQHPKIQFFYRYPEFVEMRNQIRSYLRTLEII